MRLRATARRSRRIFYGLRTAQRTKGTPVQTLAPGSYSGGLASVEKPTLFRPIALAIRTKTKRVRIGHPETGLRFASKASRIFAGTAILPHRRQAIVNDARHPLPQNGTGRSAGGQSGAESETPANRPIPREKASQKFAQAQRRQALVYQIPPVVGRFRPRLERRRMEGAQIGPESATRRVAALDGPNTSGAGTRSRSVVNRRKDERERQIRGQPAGRCAAVHVLGQQR
jgi:hypothetical protein